MHRARNGYWAHNDHGNVVSNFGRSRTEITPVGESVVQLHASDFILS